MAFAPLYSSFKSVHSTRCLPVDLDLHFSLLSSPFSNSFLYADIYKGSFYANPVVDVPTTDEALMERWE